MRGAGSREFGPNRNRTGDRYRPGHDPRGGGRSDAWKPCRFGVEARLGSHQRALGGKRVPIGRAHVSIDFKRLDKIAICT